MPEKRITITSDDDAMINTDLAEDEDLLDEDLEDEEVVAEEDDLEKNRLSATDTKFALARRLIRKLKDELSMLERLIADEAEPAEVEELMIRRRTDDTEAFAPVNEGKVVEGVFDGVNMIGSDGNPYVVPPNYASKSKLVEGDILKLTIQGNGTFLFKQIGPIERQRVVGTLMRDEMTGDWRVFAMSRKFNLLPAAVSFHRGEEGDEAVLLIPKEAPSKWAALENIIKK
jgi:hypothetical protein